MGRHPAGSTAARRCFTLSMVKSPLAQSRRGAKPAPLPEQIQLALAIADESSLRSLLSDSLPAIAQPHEVDQVRVELSLPLPDRRDRVLDALICFERVRCWLAGSRPHLPRLEDDPRCHHLTHCQAEPVTLAQNIALSEAIALLSHAGFNADQIARVLHLPSQAWHKSWWFMADIDGQLTVPFQRLMRVRHFSDGSLTLQYKDYYALEQPPSFKGQPACVPVVIRQRAERFCQTLERINQARQAFATAQAILITEALSAPEAEGFMRQNVSLFTAQAALPQMQWADCQHCQQASCPLQGQPRSPVTMCRSYVGGLTAGSSGSHAKP